MNSQHIYLTKRWEQTKKVTGWKWVVDEQRKKVREDTREEQEMMRRARKDIHVVF